MRASGLFEEKDVAVIAVSFEAPAEVARIGPHLHLPYPLYSDPDRALYRLFGMARVRLRDLGWTQAARTYARGASHGIAPRLRPGADTRQLGGDVLLGPDGETWFVHASEGAADRPSPATMAAALEGRWK